jgi:hypothetical protein
VLLRGKRQALNSFTHFFMDKKSMKVVPLLSIVASVTKRDSMTERFKKRRRKPKSTSKSSIQYSDVANMDKVRLVGCPRKVKDLQESIFGWSSASAVICVGGW